MAGDVNLGGLDLLGTCVGSAGNGTDFVGAKIDPLLSSFETCADLPHQHALLLLFALPSTEPPTSSALPMPRRHRRTVGEVAHGIAG